MPTTNEGQSRILRLQKTVRQILTTAANGVYTAQIDDAADFVSLTSGGATQYAVLPKAVEEYIGRTIDIHVGANGFELVTPEGSNDTINTVDSDGTNQLDVAANTVLRCVQITATGWAAYQVAATTITVVAPDND